MSDGKWQPDRRDEPGGSLETIREIIQEDIGHRGLRKDPAANLITACPDDFRKACHSLADPVGQAARLPVRNATGQAGRLPHVAIITGFYIPAAQPPAGETDGPLGALFLARALVPLGIKVTLVTDAFCAKALQAGLAAAGLTHTVSLIVLPSFDVAQTVGPEKYWQTFLRRAGPLTHLIALERVGPSHTLESLQAQLGSQGALGETYLAFLDQVPPDHQDRCHTMRGRDITANMSPAHWLIEAAASFSPLAPHPSPLTTIGIGDGGNEIGMGKIGWDVIQRNIPNGGLVACRVPTDHLIVCGISNWGAYGLGAGVRILCGVKDHGDLFDPRTEKCLLEVMVAQGPLVDGISALPTATVDGIAFERYAEPLRRLAALPA